MNNKKKLFIVLSILVFGTSCTVIVGNYTPPNKPVLQMSTGCNKFVEPVLPAMPDVPTIPKHLLGDKEASDNILVANISDLREYIKYIKKEYKKAAEEQLKTCQ